MNIIEAIQQAENGKCIRNGKLAARDHFLKYMGNGTFYLYELISGKAISSTKKFRYQIMQFSVADILSNDWEIFDDSGLLEER